jgi:hypothetical protein
MPHSMVHSLTWWNRDEYVVDLKETSNNPTMGGRASGKSKTNPLSPKLDLQVFPQPGGHFLVGFVPNIKFRSQVRP